MRQRRFNYQLDFTFYNGEASERVNAVSVDIPTYTRPVAKYRSARKGTVLIPGKEDPPEFTVVMDLDIEGVAGINNLDMASAGTNEVLRKLDSLLDSDADVVDVAITMVERVAGEVKATWQILATDCLVTTLAGDTLAAADDSDVMRCTVTLQPSEIKRLKIVDAS